MPSLFSLFVDLKANTADFVSGMSTASYAAKKAGRDIQDSFSTLGSIAEKALAPFGELGSIIGESLGQIGQYASSASSEIAKLSGGMSGMAIAAGTAAGAVAAIGAASIGLAVKTAESAAKMYELSKSTGISVETLSQFAFVAQQTGIDTESMSTALERMSKSAFAAATAPAGTINAYSRLGISLRDTAGNIRPVDDLLDQVADKFSVMPDGVEKSALAMQIFGRAGDAMIPFLDQGSDRIDKLRERANELGVTLTTKTAVSAEEFKQTLGELQAASEGFALKLTSALLPALQTIADKMLAISTQGHALRDLLLELAQGPIGFGAQVERKVIDSYFTIPPPPTAPAPPKPPVFPPAPLASKPKISGVADKDEIADLVTKLAAESAAELSLAASIQTSVAAMTLAKAAGEADVKIAEERSALLDRERTLRQQLAGSLAGAHPEEAAKYSADIAAVQGYLKELDRDVPLIRQRYVEIAAAKLGSSTNEDLGKESIKFDSEIDGLNRLIAAYHQGGASLAAADIGKQLEGDREKVAELAEAYAILAAREPDNITALAQLGSALLSANASLEAHRKQLEQIRSLTLSEEIAKETRAFQDQIPALAQLAAAYGQGADAVRAAEVSLKVADFQGKNPGASAGQIAQVTALYQQQSQAAYNGSIAEQASRYNLSQEYSDEIEKLNQIREVLQGNGQSTLAVDAAIYDANRKNIEQWDEYALKIGTVTDKFRAFANEIAEQGQDFGGKIFSSMSKSVDDLSTQLAKLVVTGKSNFRELFQSFEESVTKAGFQKLFSSIAAPIAGVPGEHGANAPGGTAGILPGPIGNLFSGIFGKKPAASGADGTQSNPFYTVSVDAQGNALAGKTVGSTSVIGSLFHPGAGQTTSTAGPNSPVTDFLSAAGINIGIPNLAPPPGAGTPSGPVTDFLSASGINTGIPNLAPPPGAQTSNTLGPLTSGLSSISSTVGSAIGGLGKTIGGAVGGLFSMFGGFLAGGGETSPGKAYIVGEKHPEFFMPGQRGSVVPSLKMQGGHTINQSFNFHGVTDFDSFQRSQGQISAQLHRETSKALSRNG